MAMKIFLDTNAIIDLLNENGKVIDAIANAEDIYISIINELEFKSFIVPATKTQRHEGIFLSK